MSLIIKKRDFGLPIDEFLYARAGVPGISIAW